MQYWFMTIQSKNRTSGGTHIYNHITDDWVCYFEALNSEPSEDNHILFLKEITKVEFIRLSESLG